MTVQVVDLTKHFGSFRAVDGVSFVLEDHGIVGLLGPNGAGKTTILRMLAGIEDSTSGKILYNDQPFTTQSFAHKAKIGFLPESIPLYPHLTCLETLKFFGQMHALPHDKLIERLRIVIQDCHLQTVLHKPCETLSKGFRQRLGLALALVHDPQILLLDEPTEGLDPLQIREMRQWLLHLSQSKSILISSHILAEITQLCTRVIILQHGRILAKENLAEFGFDTLAFENHFLELLRTAPHQTMSHTA